MSQSPMVRGIRQHKHDSALLHNPNLPSALPPPARTAGRPFHIPRSLKRQGQSSLWPRGAPPGNMDEYDKFFRTRQE